MSAESSDDRVVELLEQLASTDAETAAAAFVERDAYDTLEAFVERHDHDFDDGALNRLKTRLRMIRQDTQSFAEEGDRAKAQAAHTLLVKKFCPPPCKCWRSTVGPARPAGATLCPKVKRTVSMR